MGQIFPVVSLPFGTLQVQAARTAYIIKKEYGDNVLTKRRYSTNVSLVVLRIGLTYQHINVVVRGQRCSYAVLLGKHLWRCNGIALRAIICFK